MKLKELSEGLKANWTIHTIRDLPPKKLKALIINAQNANDTNVLNIIKKVEQERYDAQVAAKKAADEERAERRLEAAKRRKD